MEVLNYTVLIIGIFMLVYMIRIFFFNRKSIPAELFSEALRNENSGNFEAAVLNYETALTEVNKSRFNRGKMMRKITEKLKVLRTVINYQANFQSDTKFWTVPKS
jgi:transcriptional regulator CtsR